MHRHADVIITIGCGDACPSPAAATRNGSSTTPPASLDQVGPIRDDIERRVRDLLTEPHITPTT